LFGAHQDLELLGLLVAVGGLLALAPTLRLPLPILLVLGVDGNEQVLPAGLALGAVTAIAGHSMPRSDDPTKLLCVDVHQLARLVTLVADDLLQRRARRQS
jgi:hypothetical protein